MEQNCLEISSGGGGEGALNCRLIKAKLSEKLVAFKLDYYCDFVSRWFAVSRPFGIYAAGAAAAPSCFKRPWASFWNFSSARKEGALNEQTKLMEEI